MRLFIAIDLPDGIKEYIAEIQKALGNKFARINWVKKEQMHLTLKFLGEVQTDKKDRIIDELGKIRFEAFEAYLDSMGVFPDEESIRVLWVGLEPEDKIIELQRAVDEKLNGLFKKEKDFKVHITLGRVKYSDSREKFLDGIKRIGVEKKKFIVDKFKLMKSTLTSEGPVYELIEEFKA